MGLFYFFTGTTPGTSSPPNEEEDAAILRAKLDAECQQLARDLQAAVRELVRPEQLGGLVGNGNIKSSGIGKSSSATNFMGNGGLGRGSNSSGAGSSSNHSTKTRATALNETHDYSEIYTPSSDDKLGLTVVQPPPPPMHRLVNKS